MKHWLDTFPHKVYASVLLKDGKITNWKIGQRKWEHIFDMTRMLKVPFDVKDYEGETVESTEFEVNSNEEHNKVFTELAREWFKNWEIHEEIEGGAPY